MTDDVCKDPGKILKIFVCDSIICQLDLIGYIVWKTYKQVKLNFRDTAKKLAKSQNLSMTKSLSNILFSPIAISMSLSKCLFLWKKCQVHIKLVYCLKIFKMYTLLKTRFCINVVFPHPACPTTKMLPSNLSS